MIAFPPAKINLGLAVRYKRPDGYHELNTCFYTTGWTDVLEVVHAEEFSFTEVGEAATAKPEDNLCVKAYKLMQQQHNIRPVAIALLKHLPQGAGLGGGSADAAHTLLLLDKLFDLQLSQAELADMALKLGADCPFFLHKTACIGRGIGEQLEPFSLDLSGYYLHIVWPGVAVPTARAFGNLQPAEPKWLPEQVVQLPPEQWKDKLKNDFEPSVFEQYPQIAALKKLLYNTGAIYASMSGSGSAVYGLFSNEVAIKAEAGWKSWGGWL
jgi:4-diphosphocytidyl-2-C-methyl-D-erythritol kinase